MICSLLVRIVAWAWCLLRALIKRSEIDAEAKLKMHQETIALEKEKMKADVDRLKIVSEQAAAEKLRARAAFLAELNKLADGPLKDAMIREFLGAPPSVSP